MKIAFIILSIIVTNSLSSVRELFFEENSEKVNTELYEKTQTATLQSDPIIYAYNGLAIMRKAEYTFNPYSKLSYFKKGKNKIESAIKLKPNNSELRFIRFSVQTNIPSFLGYSSDVEKDKLNVLDAIKNKNFNNDLNFTKNVINFLLKSEALIVQEKSELKQVDR